MGKGACEKKPEDETKAFALNGRRLPLGVVGGREKGLYFHILGSFILRSGVKRGMQRVQGQRPRFETPIFTFRCGAPALSNIGELNSAA
jgi:hypothetical protein